MKVDRITHSRDIHSKFSKTARGRISDLVQPEVHLVDSPTPKTISWSQTWSISDDPLWKYRHLTFSKMVTGRRILFFALTGNSAIPSADPENPPTLETNLKWIGRPDFVHTHFHHISTSGRRSGDGFRIAHPEFLFSHYGSTRLSFRDIGMGQTDDRKSTPLLKVSTCYYRRTTY